MPVTGPFGNKWYLGTRAEFQAANTVMLNNHRGIEMDTGYSKAGDGTTPWNSILDYISQEQTDHDVRADQFAFNILASVAINTKEPSIAGGTVSQYWRGDKTFQTLLGNTSTTAAPGDETVRVYRVGSGQLKGIKEVESSATSTGSTSLTFNLTLENTAGGTAIFATDAMKETLNVWVDDATIDVFVGGYTFAANRKTLTLTVQRRTFTTGNVLLNLLGALTSVLTGTQLVALPNGTVVHLTIRGQ